MSEPGDDDITAVFDWDAASWRRLRQPPVEYIEDCPELGMGAEQSEPEWDHEDWDEPEYTGDESGIRYLPEK